MRAIDGLPAGGGAAQHTWPDLFSRRAELLLVLGGGALLGLALLLLPSYLWAPIAAFILSVWLAVAHPRRAAQLAVFLVPWQIFLGNLPGSTYTFRLADIVVGCSLVVSLLRHPRAARLSYTVWLLPPILFVGLGTLSGLLRGDLFPTAKFVVDWWPSIAFYWLMLIWAPKYWRGLLAAFLLSFSLQAVVALIQTWIGDVQVITAALSQPIASVFFEPDFLSQRLALNSFNFVWQGRAYGFGSYLSSGGLAINLAASGTVAWALAMRARRWLTSRYLFISLLMYAASALTFKRSGWVAIGVGFFAVIVLNFGPRRANLQRALLVLVLVAAVVVPLVIREREALLARATDQSTFDFGRQYTWPAYLRLILQRPIVGYGPNYPMGSVETGLAAQFGYYYNYEFGLDNSYLYLAIVAGLPGLLLMLLTAAYAVTRLRPLASYDLQTLQQAGLGGLAAYLVGGLFIVILGDLQVSGTFFLLLALAYALASTTPKQQTHG